MTTAVFEESRDLITEAARARFLEAMVEHQPMSKTTADALFVVYVLGFVDGAAWITENHAHQD